MSDLELPGTLSNEENGLADQGPGEALGPSSVETTSASVEAKARADGHGWQSAFMLIALLLISVFASTRTGLPRPVAANAPDSVFSSARAMTTLVGMVRRAHPPGSPEHAWVRGFIVEEMLKLATARAATCLLRAPCRSPRRASRGAPWSSRWRSCPRSSCRCPP